MRAAFLLLVVLASLSGCYSRVIYSHIPPRSIAAGESTREFPFQVLYSQSAFSSSKELRYLQPLSVNDTVHLTSGYLIIVHHSGEFTEFKGDTALLMSQVAGRSSWKGRSKAGKSFRPDVGFLYSDSPSHYWHSRGAVIHCMPTAVRFISPIDYSVEVPYNTNYCLWWKSNSEELTPREYTIEVKNIFDELVERRDVDGNKAELDLTSYLKKGHSPLFIVSVFDRHNPQFRSADVGIKLGPEPNDFFTSCNVESAVKALEIAWNLEAAMFYTEAEEYFALATQLSDRKIFETFQANFIKRRSK